MRRFIVIGLGNFGSSVAESLYTEGHDVVAVDLDEEAVDRIASHVSRSAVGDGRDVDTLQQVGAGDADLAVISTGDDITASILATMALGDLGVEEVYVKVVSRNHARVMTRLGVSETVFPERESALNLASRLSDRSIVNYVHMSQDLGIQEMVVLGQWEGKSLRELSLRSRYGVSVIAIHNILTDEMAIPPDPDAPLKESDTLLVAGRDEALDRLAQLE